MKFHLLSALCVVAALLLELAGFATVGSVLAIIFLGAGLSLEALFWARLLRGRTVRTGG